MSNFLLKGGQGAEKLRFHVAVLRLFLNASNRIIDGPDNQQHGQRSGNHGLSFCGKLIFDVARVAAFHHLGALVVDEIQHLLDAPGVGPAKMLNFLVTFAHEVKMPFVVLGTPKAKSILGTLLREARGLSDQGSYKSDRMKKDEDWDLFLKALWKYQWLKEPDAQAMYDQTQGVTALVVRRFQLSQWHAIRSKSENITADVLKLLVLGSVAVQNGQVDVMFVVRRRDDVVDGLCGQGREGRMWYSVDNLAGDLVSFIDDALPCEKQDWIGRQHWSNGSQVVILASGTKAVRVIVAWRNRCPQLWTPVRLIP